MTWSVHIVLTLVAILWIGQYLYSWFRVVAFFNTEPIQPSNISNESIEIICTFRNEKATLTSFLDNCRLILEEPSVCITLVNDHSDDNSAELIQEHAIFGNKNFQLIHSPHNIQGKKQNLNWAIEKSNATIILTTDADCIISRNSVESLYGLLMEKQADLALGLIAFEGGNSIIEWYQKIENSALVALSTYHAHLGSPTMGNAANMIFRRSAYLKTQPFKDNLNIAGGDDIFMIQAFLKSGYRVIYSNDLNTQVTTSVLSNWNDTWQQRIRWAQKSNYQEFGPTQKSQIQFVVFLVFLWGISIHFMLNQEYAVLFGIWSFKILGEFIFIERLFTKLKQPQPSYRSIIMSSILQSVWVPAVALLQFFVPVKWKGRLA